MARRARQKRRRSQPSGPRPTGPHRENVPGSLDHASGEVEEFEAGIVAGAQGVPDDEADQPFDDDADSVAEDADEELLEELAPAGGPATAHRPAAKKGGSRVLGFLVASWAELQRVQWPDRRQVAQATAVVLGFVVIAGAYLGLADEVAKRVIDFIL